MYRLLLTLKWFFGRRVNLLGVLGVAVAVWALILVPGIFEGYMRELRKHVHATSADLTLIVLGGAAPVSFARIERLLGARGEVAAIAPRYSWFGLILPKEEPSDPTAETQGFFQVAGVDFAREAPRLAPWLAAVEDPKLRCPNQTSPLSARPGEPPKLLMGVEKARAFGLERGDRVLLTTGVPPSGPRGDVRAEVIEFELAGCFSSENFEFDDFTVFCDVEILRRRLAADGRGPADPINEAAITLEAGVPLAAGRDRLQAILDENEIPARIFTWEEKQQRFLESVEHQSSILKLILFALMLIGTFLIFADLTMMVNEKVRDIGILNALGATRTGILSVFLILGLTTAVAGFLLGTLAARISSRNLDAFHDWLARSFDLELFPSDVYGLKHIPYAWNWNWVLSIGAAALVLAALFSLVPSWRAARVDPIKSLHTD